jgi:hypothetical protein
MRFFFYLQADGDLLEEELDDIWEKAPKFPDVTASAARIDVDSFVQVYRDIDDLFEDDSEESNPEQPAAAVREPTETKETPAADDQTEDTDKTMEDELESVFNSIADDNGLISKQALMNWDEIEKLLSDGLLGADEFEELWGKTKKSLGADDKLDIDGFLSFNVALDSLFEFSDEEMEEDNDDDSAVEGIVGNQLVEEGDRSPQELFALLAGADCLVSKGDLMRWAELLELIEEGDLTMSELDEIFSASAVAEKLDETRFLALYKAIDDLFEYDVNDKSDESSESFTDGQKVPEDVTTNDPPSSKTTLLGMLEVLNEDNDLLPCGLEASDREQANILKVINTLEQESSNLIRSKQGAVDENDLAGNWELLYSSSSAMKFNKGLSGLGGSFPNGKFGGLKMRLDSSKFMSDVEYTERISVTPEAASFDVTVTGDWTLRQSISLFTGEPSITLAITPERVNYGPTSTRADHWKSLGPLNMLDVAYLDKDLRIMRGSTSLDTVFVFRRVA